MSKIAVLGAGNIGKFIGEYLTANSKHDVTVFDYSKKVLEGVEAKTVVQDLSIPINIEAAIINTDIVINALPSVLGFRALKASVKHSKHVVDFSYMTEDPRQLDSLAKQKNATVVTDFGFAPGMCHMFVGRALKVLGQGINSTIYVGGLPIKESDEYKEVFSARDVLEEYSRPARSIKDGQVISEIPYEHNLPWVSTLPNGREVSLSGFVSDGLRTMLNLPGINNLVESTLRYPKHFDKMVGLKEDGFFQPSNIEQTAKILSEKWKRGPEDRDLSLLNVYSSKGLSTVEHLLYDEYDETNKIHSMARVTGFPVIIIAEMIANGEFNRPGVNIPEVLGQDDKLFNTVCDRLRDQGITLTENITTKVGE